MSTNTGRAPTVRMTLLVATQDRGVVITSSPGPMPAIRKATSMVQVPELKARTGLPPTYAESCASNALTCGPEVIQPERSTSATPRMVSSSMLGRVKGRKLLTVLTAPGDYAARARMKTPAMMSAMPASFAAVRGSPKRAAAANALTT